MEYGRCKSWFIYQCQEHLTETRTIMPLNMAIIYETGSGQTLYVNKSNSVVWINNQANNKINVESFNFNNNPFIFNDQITFHDIQKERTHTHTQSQLQDVYTCTSIITRNSNRNLYSNNYKRKSGLGRYNWITRPISQQRHWISDIIQTTCTPINFPFSHRK